MDDGAAAVVINAEDLMESAAWDGAAIGRLLDAVGMEHLLLEAPHSQVRYDDINASSCPYPRNFSPYLGEGVAESLQQLS